MKICVAQTRPAKGDIQSNIAHHKKLIAAALASGTGIIIFPELSITGYEPELAAELATSPDDYRFDEFQHLSDNENITIGFGVPLKTDTGIAIGLLIFQPYTERQVYFKTYLHSDEEPLFVSRQNDLTSISNQKDIALAICYELFVPEHSEKAHENGARIYIASVAKSANGVEKAFTTLSGIARKYSMTVLLSNCVGHCDNFEGGGKSAVWNNQGQLIGGLDDTTEGFLIYDTDTEELFQKQYNANPQLK